MPPKARHGFLVPSKSYIPQFDMTHRNRDCRNAIATGHKLGGHIAVPGTNTIR